MCVCTHTHTHTPTTCIDRAQHLKMPAENGIVALAPLVKNARASNRLIINPKDKKYLLLDPDPRPSTREACASYSGEDSSSA